jgi:DNA-binding phage protein
MAIHSLTRLGNYRRLDSKGNATLITISKLIVAPYFLKVSINNKEVKTFKIIKY